MSSSTIQRHLSIALGSVVLLLTQAQLTAAQLTNPAIEASLGTVHTNAESGSIFVNYLIVVWRAAISFAALMLLIYLIWGGVQWIVAGGDNGKIQKARDTMTNSAVGFIVLTGGITIIQLIGSLIGFDILKLSFPSVF